MGRRWNGNREAQSDALTTPPWRARISVAGFMASVWQFVHGRFQRLLGIAHGSLRATMFCLRYALSGGCSLVVWQWSGSWCQNGDVKVMLAISAAGIPDRPANRSFTCFAAVARPHSMRPLWESVMVFPSFSLMRMLYFALIPPPFPLS